MTREQLSEAGKKKSNRKREKKGQKDISTDEKKCKQKKEKTKGKNANDDEGGEYDNRRG
jgi:hypothetical protein